MLQKGDWTGSIKIEKTCSKLNNICKVIHHHKITIEAIDNYRKILYSFMTVPYTIYDACYYTLLKPPNVINTCIRLLLDRYAPYNICLSHKI